MPQRVEPVRFSTVCYTLNNYTEEDIKLYQSITDCSYHVYGQEIGDNGTPHLQGYIEFGKKRKVFSSVKKILPKAHFEKPKASDPRDAAGYCKKGPTSHDDKPPEGWRKFFFEPHPEWIGFEQGTIFQPGKRTDLDDMATRIAQGEKVDDLTIENPIMFHQYGRTMQRIEDILLRKKYRTWFTKSIWLWGTTSVGKSHRAFANYSSDTHYKWKYDGGWQDGYTGQPIVIINEFRGQIPFSELLEMLDKWPHEVRRRGREPAPFLATHVIITSSSPPEAIYHNICDDTERLDQLTERCKIIHIESRDQDIDPWEDQLERWCSGQV